MKTFNDVLDFYGGRNTSLVMIGISLVILFGYLVYERFMSSRVRK
jgi:hypothetical protein